MNNGWCSNDLDANEAIKLALDEAGDSIAWYGRQHFHVESNAELSALRFIHQMKVFERDFGPTEMQFADGSRWSWDLPQITDGIAECIHLLSEKNAGEKHDGLLLLAHAKFKLWEALQAYEEGRYWLALRMIGLIHHGITGAVSSIGITAQVLSKNAREGGKAKHALDPKQAEKKFVLECWKDWRRDPPKPRWKAAFARAMLDKCEHLESTKVIEDWCREWEKSEPY